MDKNLEYLGYRNNILDTVPKAQSKKEMLANIDFINIKNVCSTTDTEWQDIAKESYIVEKKNLQNIYLIK